MELKSENFVEKIFGLLIISLAFLVRFLNVYRFPLFNYGFEPWFYWRLTHLFLENKIDLFDLHQKYEEKPAFYVLMVSIILFFGFPVFDIFRYLPIFIGTFAVSSMFLLARNVLKNKKQVIFSGIFLSAVADFFISSTDQYQPECLGLLFISIFFYFWSKFSLNKSKKMPKNFILAILFFFLLCLTDNLGAGLLSSTIILICLFMVLFRIYDISSAFLCLISTIFFLFFSGFLFTLSIQLVVLIFTLPSLIMLISFLGGSKKQNRRKIEFINNFATKRKIFFVWICGNVIMILLIPSIVSQTNFSIYFSKFTEGNFWLWVFYKIAPKFFLLSFGGLGCILWLEKLKKPSFDFVVFCWGLVLLCLFMFFALYFVGSPKISDLLFSLPIYRARTWLLRILPFLFQPLCLIAGFGFIRFFDFLERSFNKRIVILFSMVLLILMSFFGIRGAFPTPDEGALTSEQQDSTEYNVVLWIKSNFPDKSIILLDYKWVYIVLSVYGDDGIEGSIAVSKERRISIFTFSEFYYPENFDWLTSDRIPGFKWHQSEINFENCFILLDDSLTTHGIYSHIQLSRPIHQNELENYSKTTFLFQIYKTEDARIYAVLV